MSPLRPLTSVNDGGEIDGSFRYISSRTALMSVLVCALVKQLPDELGIPLHYATCNKAAASHSLANLSRTSP